jgi:UDP-N-acetylmuramyl tripeptide synthase
MPMPLQHAHTLSTAEQASAWLASRAKGLACDSRHLRPGEAFVAWPGAAHDARRFIAQALAAGASACLAEAEGAELSAMPDDDRVAVLPQLKLRLGEVASAFYGQPSQQLDVVAVTGTNGKTSCTWWLAQALSLLGRQAGVVGTLGVGCRPPG